MLEWIQCGREGRGAGLIAEPGQLVQRLDRREGFHRKISQGHEKRPPFLRGDPPVSMLYGCTPFPPDRSFRRRPGMFGFQAGQNLPRSAEHWLRHAGELGHMDTVGSIGSSGGDLVQESTTAILYHRLS